MGGLNKIYSIVFLAALLAPIATSTSARAEDATDSYDIRITAGDGKNGRVFAKWQELIQDRPVETVSVRLQKRSGGADAYVNLRFGSGATFENGRRIALTDGRPQTVTWNVNGARSGGQPLVLNAYNCEVDINSAEVVYSGTRRPSSYDDERRPNNPGAGPNDNYERPYGNDYRPDDSDRPQDQRWDEPAGHPPGGYGGRGDTEAGRRCRETRIRSPQIEIGQIRPTGGLFSGKYKFEGAIAGICIEEAGYYEKGRLKERIELPLSDTFQRKEFEVKVRTGEKGEIRVFTSDGKEQFVAVDAAVQKTNPF